MITANRSRIASGSLLIVILLARCASASELVSTQVVTRRTQEPIGLITAPTLTIPLPTLIVTIGPAPMQVKPIAHLMKGDISNVIWSPDGQVLAVISPTGIRLYEAATLHEIVFWEEPLGLRQTIFAPNGTTLVTISYADMGDSESRQVAKLRDWANHDLIFFSDYLNPVVNAAFSPDSKTVALVYRDNTIGLREVTTHRELQTLSNPATVASLAFAPDGKVLAVGYRDNTIKLYDLATGWELLTLNAHTAAVASVAFSPDGQFLASGSDDQTARLWDTATGREVHNLAHAYAVTAVAFSPDGQTLITKSEFHGHSTQGTTIAVKQWNVATGLEIHAFNKPAGYHPGVAWTPDGKFLAVWDYAPSIAVWDVTNQRESYLLALVPDQGADQGAAFAPDGKTLASWSQADTVRLWDVTTGRELRHLDK